MDGDDAGGGDAGSGRRGKRGGRGGGERRGDPGNGMERKVVEDVDSWEEDRVRRTGC